MNSKVVKTTSKGQITIPKEWREKFETENFVLKYDEQKMVIIPIIIVPITDEEVLFDAEKDNDGKGISPDEMIKLLKEI